MEVFLFTFPASSLQPIASRPCRQLAGSHLSVRGWGGGGVVYLPRAYKEKRECNSLQSNVRAKTKATDRIYYLLRAIIY